MIKKKDMPDIVNGIKDGNKSALEKLYKDKCDKSIAYLITAFNVSENDAYDITSSVFSEISNTINNFRGGDFDKWFITVLNNQARDYIKKESRTIPVDIDMLEKLIMDNEPDTDIVPDIEKEQAASKLREIIDSLPDRQKQAATFHYIDGLTVSETADKMGISYDTAKEHLKRAKRAITEKVQAEGNKSQWLGSAVILSNLIKSDAEGGLYTDISAKIMAVGIKSTATSIGTGTVAKIAITKNLGGLSLKQSINLSL